MKKALLLALVAIFAFAAMPLFAQGTAPAATSIAAPAAPDAGVGKLTYGPGKWIAVHLLLQAQYTNTNTWDTNAGEDDSDGVWASSFKLRRARLIVSGQVSPLVEFFVETDDYNRGGLNNDAASTGTRTDGTFVQDAFINFKIAPELNITMGMFLIPFMHHNRQSAASLLGVDYNTDVIKLATTTNVWRDTGVEFRGLLFGGIVDYRLAVLQGISRDTQATKTTADTDTSNDINPDGLPRFTGRIQINLMDAEDGHFYSENYLGKKKIVSFGGGIDYQADVANADVDRDDYLAWTVDFIFDYPLAPGTALAFQAAYVNIDNYPSGTIVGESYIEEQYGYFAQVGLLLFDTIQPVIKYTRWITKDLTTTDGGTDDSISSYLTVGLNYMLHGHNANIKFEYRHPLGEDQNGVDQIDTPNQQMFTLQTQIYI